MIYLKSIICTKYLNIVFNIKNVCISTKCTNWEHVDFSHEYI